MSRANDAILKKITAIALTDSVHSFYSFRTRRFPKWWRKVNRISIDHEMPYMP